MLSPDSDPAGRGAQRWVQHGRQHSDARVAHQLTCHVVACARPRPAAPVCLCASAGSRPTARLLRRPTSKPLRGASRGRAEGRLAKRCSWRGPGAPWAGPETMGMFKKLFHRKKPTAASEEVPNNSQNRLGPGGGGTALFSLCVRRRACGRRVRLPCTCGGSVHARVQRMRHACA